MTTADMEEKTRQSEKLHGRLEMMGRVCHDLNQPLMAISAYSEIISMKLPTDDPLHETICKMTEQVEKMGRISRKLMGISMMDPNEGFEGSRIPGIEREV